MIREEGKRHYAPIEDFNTLMCDHKLHCRKKKLCRYWLQSFSTAEILKYHVNDWFKVNGKQMIKMWLRLKKVKVLESKTMKGNNITIYDICRLWKYLSARRKWEGKSR